MPFKFLKRSKKKKPNTITLTVNGKSEEYTQAEIQKFVNDLEKKCSRRSSSSNSNNVRSSSNRVSGLKEARNSSGVSGVSNRRSSSSRNNSGRGSSSSRRRSSSGRGSSGRKKGYKKGNF